MWQHTDVSQRARLVAGIFESMEVDTTPAGQITLVAVPRPGWKGFFTRVVSERETRDPNAHDHIWSGIPLLLSA